MNRLGIKHRDYLFLNELRNLICSACSKSPALQAISSDIVEGLETVVSNLDCFDAGLNYLLRCLSQLSELK